MGTRQNREAARLKRIKDILEKTKISDRLEPSPSELETIYELASGKPVREIRT